MKGIITIVSFLMSLCVFSQSPSKMSYQAIVRDTSNQLIISTSVGMRISILKGSANGTAVYVETQTPTSDNNGLVGLEIGGGTVISGNLTTVDWSNDTYFIKTETDPTGGTNYLITGTSQLLSAPYALHAKTTETSNGVFTHYVGELYGGGIVVAVWKENGVEHGLIASLTDISTSIRWSSIISGYIKATNNTDGRLNTADIIAQGDVSGAAYLCDNYSSGGFNDWYLPANWELYQCYINLLILNTVLPVNDGFMLAHYWSSTENASPSAWSVSFFNGEIHGNGKHQAFRVRAFRRF